MSRLTMWARRTLLRDPRLRKRLSRIYVKANARFRRRRVVLHAAFVEGRWRDFIDLVEEMENSPGVRVSPAIYVQLSASHAQLGEPAAALATLQRAERKMPWSDLVLRGLAEWAMHEGDYSRAVVYWQRFAMSTDKRPPARAVGRARPFPVRGSDIDWYEVAWAQVATGWDTWWQQAGQRPNAVMYARMLATMVACEHREGLAKLSGKALRDWPNDEVLVMRVCDAVVRLGPDGEGETVSSLLERFGGSSTVGRVAAQMSSAQPLLDDLRQRGPAGPGQLRVLNVRHLSGADFLVRANNYWDARRIASEAMRLAERDRWPEGFADTDVLSEQAMTAARAFAKGRAHMVALSEAALARAVFHFVKHELCLKLPADRIAKEIADTCGDEPVFVELPSLRMDYLASYPNSKFQQIYLYAALRHRGCNVFFVRFPATKAGSRRRRLRSSRVEMAPLVVRPRVDGLRPRFLPLNEAPASHRLVVPAGIRSMAGVLDLVDPAMVVNSASVIKGFAYDRSFRQAMGFAVHAELHPDGRLLPTFRFPLHLNRWWTRSATSLTSHGTPPRSDAEVEVSLAEGVAWTGDWYGLLAQVLMPYVGQYVGKADEFLEEHSVTELHISDYLYAEPSILAARVKQRGGTVNIWPHSTNPVHLPFHDPAMIDSVRAITRSGAEAWRHRAPHATVVQAPQLMLKPPDSRVAWQPGEPLSIVVIGGRPKLRNLPILDIAAHEELYRQFFDAMSPLVSSGAIKVYFKPRGLTGEHEAWLDTVVGRTADWARVLAHPNRIDLPNPLFVSVSVSSSALLEGVARGIPGMVVRGGNAARDYIAAGTGSVEEIAVAQVAERLRQLANEQDWTTLRETEAKALEWELQVPDVDAPLG